MNTQFVLKKINLHRLMHLFILSLLSVALFSCSKDDDASPEELKDEVGNVPGLGETGGTPQGTTFSLPDGITVVGDITGQLCDEATFTIGSGHYVTVCVGLSNDTEQEKTITFPAGLVLISTTDNYQNGVVLTTESFAIPPKQTIRFVFHTYCGNASRSSASSSAVYTFGPITNSKLITRLINDLKNKKISVVDYMNGDDVDDEFETIASTVQALLWMITDSDLFSLDWMTFEMIYKQQLETLPNK